jgi:hypothetical protein
LRRVVAAGRVNARARVRWGAERWLPLDGGPTAQEELAFVFTCGWKVATEGSPGVSHVPRDSGAIGHGLKERDQTN